MNLDTGLRPFPLKHTVIHEIGAPFDLKELHNSGEKNTKTTQTS